MIIRTRVGMFYTARTNINWFWILNSTWRDCFLFHLHVVNDWCCIAITKSWSDSLVFYLTCITNGTCLFAAVSPMVASALSFWEWNMTSIGPGNPEISSRYQIVEQASMVLLRILCNFVNGEAPQEWCFFLTCLFLSMERTFWVTFWVARKLRNVEGQIFHHEELG